MSIVLFELILSVYIYLVS